MNHGKAALASLIVAGILLALPAAAARDFRERLQQARAASLQPATRAPDLPAGTRVLREVAYGEDPRQRFDVYLPADVPPGAPVILLAHGGGWAYGNKDNPGLVENKAADWLPKGRILVSTNYRMRPDTAPLDQARDLARALARVQHLAPEWGGDPSRVVLMGHSAGAHLAVLVGASSTFWREAGATRPLGVVSLDSGALDVPELMQRPRIPPLYRRAFGDDPDDWGAASPRHRIDASALPMLLVCSTRRRDACAQADALQARATELGVAVEVLPQDLSHGQINHELGLASRYTAAVDHWLDALLD